MTSEDKNDNIDGLQPVPFAEDIQVDLFYPGARRRLLLEEVKAAIIDEVAVITLTGDEGSGKSMICHMVKKELPDNLYRIYFPDPLESFNDVLRAIALQLGIDAANTSASTSERVTEGIELLKREGKRLVAIFDESDRMYLATVERIRKMLDLANENETILQVIFAGRTSLLENLDRLSIVEFSSSKEAAFSLAPLGLSETFAYLNYASQQHIHGRNKNLFTPEAAKKIYSMARGNLRVTNMLAAKSLEMMDPESSSMVLVENVYEDVPPKTEEKKQKKALLSLFFSGKKIYLGGSISILTVILLIWLNLDSGNTEKQTVLSENEQPVIAAETPDLPSVTELRKNNSEKKRKPDNQKKQKKGTIPAQVSQEGGVESSVQEVRNNKDSVKEKQIVLKEIDASENLETLKIIEATLRQSAERDIDQPAVFPENRVTGKGKDAENVEKAEMRSSEQAKETEDPVIPANVAQSSVAKQEEEKTLAATMEKEKEQVKLVPEDGDDVSQAVVNENEEFADSGNTVVIQEGDKDEERRGRELEEVILEIHRNGREKIVHDITVSDEQVTQGTGVENTSPEERKAGEKITDESQAGSADSEPLNNKKKNAVAINGKGDEKMEVSRDVQLAGQTGSEGFEPIIIAEMKKRFPLSQIDRDNVPGVSPSSDVAKKAAHIAPVRVIHQNEENERMNPAVIPDGKTLYKEALQTGKRWLRGENASLYTLQLMVVPLALSEKTLEDDFETMVYRKLPGPLSVLRNEENLFLFYGNYPDVETARQARSQLPEKLKKYEPYPLSVNEAVEKSILE